MVREHWRSRFGFITATAGFSIGLGNIWRFPYLCGMSGGGAFLLVYVVFSLAICVPLLIAEISLGRRTQLTPVSGMRRLSGRGSPWNLIGWFGVAAACLIMSYYFVVLGWVLAYLVKTVSGQFAGLSSERVEGLFTEFAAKPELVMLYTFAIIVLLALIVGMGLNRGIERTCKVLLPGLFLFLLVLAVRSLSFPGALEGLRWYLTPQFSVLTSAIVLSALGQAFYSIGVGMAAAFAYGSYLPPESDIPGNSLFVVCFDMLAAFLAGLVIFPALFAFGLSPDSGAGLLFVTMSRLFAEMPGGPALGGAFYFLVLLAGLTSGIGLLEAVSASFMDLTGTPRTKAVFLTLVFVFLLGIPPMLAEGPWSGVLVWGMNCFDLADFVSGNILLPLGALMLALYTAFVWRFDSFRDYANQGSANFRVSNRWKLLYRVIIPASLVLILVRGLDIY